MQVRVLGAFAVTVDGSPAELGGPKPRTLLALLVAAGGRAVPVDRLVDQIWGDDPPARAEVALQSYVARLRRVLEPARQVRAQAAVLQTHPGGYSLHVDDAAVDARRFRDLLDGARSASGQDPEEAERLLVRALETWGGEPYPGVATSSPVLVAEATRLTELWLGAQEELWALRLDRGEHASAVPELEHLVQAEPLRERFWALLALARYRSAQQGEALETIRRARGHLAEELGIDPGEELQRLEQAILRQDPALAVRAAGPPTRPAGRTPASGTGMHRGAEMLVGREDALAEAEAALRGAAAGRGRIVLVTGEAGIGKTRLCDALVDRAADAGFRTGWGSWDADDAPPLWGWQRAVSTALGRDEPLNPSSGDVRDAPSETYRLAESLIGELRAGPPTLLVLDDLHWADPDSLRLLRRLASELPRVPVALVVALRAGALDTAGPVGEALAALARLDPVRIELAGLSAEAIHAYVRQHSGTDVPETIAGELARRTQGNPFYVGELVRLLTAEGALGAPGSAAWGTVPRGVLDVVRRRLDSDPETATVLAEAAVAGRSFDIELLQEASSADARTVDRAVQTAVDLGLLEEDGPATFRFTHDLVRDAVYETLSPLARTRTHAAVAVALEHHHAGHLTEHAAELAEHYRLAGRAHVRSAWSFARAAGEAAAARSSHDEARRLLTVADDLQRLDPSVGDEERERVQVALGRALRRLSRPLEAWSPFAAAAASALRRGDAPTAASMLLEVSVDAVWGWRLRAQVDEAAIASWETLHAALSDGAHESLLAEVEAALAVELLYLPGSQDRATALVDSAIARVRREGDPVALVRVLQLAAMALARPHFLNRRVALTDELVELTTRGGHERALAAALVGRAAARAELGRLDDARSDMVRARDLAELHHLGQILLITGWGLTIVQLAHDRFEEVESAVADLQRLNDSLSIPGAGIDSFIVATTRLLQGRLGELEPALQHAARLHPTAVRDMHALALVADGRADEARDLLGPWGEQPPLLEDYLWTTLTVLRAWLWLELDDPEAVAQLRRQLTPYAEHLAAGSMSSSFLGSVAHTLGRLALADRDLAAARAHLGDALGVHQALGLDAWAGRTREVLAELDRRDRPDPVDRSDVTG